VLRAGDLLLRPWARDDAGVVLSAFADPDISYWNLETLSGQAAACAWIDQWAIGWQAESKASWAVAEVATGEVLGRVALRGISLEYGHAECTYWTLPAGRGRGVASSAARVVSRWALDVVGLHRIELQHSTRNAASCRVALRAGFAVEGVRRQALRHADGWHDMHLHGLVAGDPDGGGPPAGGGGNRGG
jgi:RimJ/RimL family protein N-acetyltransferase